VQEGEGTQTTADETLVPPQAEAGGQAADAGTGEATAAADPLAAMQEEAAQFKDKLLRTLADFDNFRKRSRREVDDARRSGRDHLLKELLPVFDNLERAVEHALRAGSSETDWKGLGEGISLVIRQLKDTLSRMGIERIEAQGQAFDPALHEAIQQLETNDHPPGTVAAEVQAGYREGDRLVRPALVVVAKAKIPSSDASSDPGTGSS
jgi:molecular chaperone GrpE